VREKLDQEQKSLNNIAGPTSFKAKFDKDLFGDDR
jgi:hypothetical protein